jgi:hypothetical protein
MRHLLQILPGLVALAAGPLLEAQTVSRSANLPRVVVPTTRATAPTRSSPTRHSPYPWKKNITATVFWIGEKATARNPTPNSKSSWDQAWKENFGGFDDPDPARRIASHTRSEFRPRAFEPKLNPFYVALPYNDVARGSRHKPEAARVIPWFAREDPEPGRTVLKGRWLQIYHEGRMCYAQWEDCGPWATDDWRYVFGSQPPKNRRNGGAGIDISPAVRDYLGLKSGETCHWRFVEDAHVPHGPWKRYGTAPTPPQRAPDGTDLEAKRRYIQHLRKLRDAHYRRYGSSRSRR